jgi:DNA-binding response OmpR family regulator
VASILLLEDEAMVRRMVCRMLVQAGHDVLETGDPEAALGLVSVYSPNVVIADVMLSGRDGIAVLLAIRRLFPSLPLIAISGRDRQEISGRLWDAGLCLAVWLLIKPFGQAELLATIKAALVA